MADRYERQSLSHTQTQKFSNFDKELANSPKQVLATVHHALKEKGYNPVNQIVGYILSGDPTYITSHLNARSLICKLERDELLEELVMFYLNNNLSD
ncbi:MAG: IreB family regulatory phosphoprotein [Defluviitaleaceae bacterium]|nr:IreB family regulatory phosphoprotein [Defluviitaleaceae bacterium]